MASCRSITHLGRWKVLSQASHTNHIPIELAEVCLGWCTLENDQAMSGARESGWRLIGLVRLWSPPRMTPDVRVTHKALHRALTGTRNTGTLFSAGIYGIPFTLEAPRFKDVMAVRLCSG